MMKPSFLALTNRVTALALLLGATASAQTYYPYTKLNYPVQPTASGQNMLRNGNWETSTYAGWIVDPALLSAGLIQSRSDAFHTGSYGLQMVPSATLDSKVLHSELPYLNPARTYQLSVWLKGVAASPALVDIGMGHKNISGGPVAGQISVRPTGTWAQYTYTFSVAAGDTEWYAYIQLYRGQTGVTAIRMDDATLLSQSNEWSAISASTPTHQSATFTEDFVTTSTHTAPTFLSANRWLVVKKAWGNFSMLNNNGVIPENIEIVSGASLRLHGHGLDNTTGPVGLNGGRDRVGACIATKEYYASGRYEVVAKVAPGMICAIWPFHYIEDPAYEGGGIKNTEIDWETPSNCAISGSFGGKSLINDANLNAWGGRLSGEGVDNAHPSTAPGCSYQDNLTTSATFNAASGFHTYRIDWHTGSTSIAPSVSWYFDNHLIRTVTNANWVPFRAARLWIGVWYGNPFWICGSDTTRAVMHYSDRWMDIQKVTITPFNEANDKNESETDPFVGYAPPIYSTYHF